MHLRTSAERDRDRDRDREKEREREKEEEREREEQLLSTNVTKSDSGAASGTNKPHSTDLTKRLTAGWRIEGRFPLFGWHGFPPRRCLSSPPLTLPVAPSPPRLPLLYV